MCEMRSRVRSVMKPVYLHIVGFAVVESAPYGDTLAGASAA